jgi:hypothetical protein
MYPPVLTFFKVAIWLAQNTVGDLFAKPCREITHWKEFKRDLGLTRMASMLQEGSQVASAIVVMLGLQLNIGSTLEL